MAPKKQEDTDASAPADPQPATALTSASGAIVEPQILNAVDVTHPSVDANPRESTAARQNAIDWNDPNRVTPEDDQFAGEGLDLTFYGKGSAS